MSNILKRTKKSCLKFFRRISTTSQNSKERLNYREDNSAPREVYCNKIENPYAIRRNFFEIYSTPQHFQKEPNAIYNQTPETNDRPEKRLTCNGMKKRKSSEHSIRPKSCRFRRLSTLKTESRDQSHSETLSDDNNNFSNEIVFEQVNFKENTRYLRHSPDRSSLEQSSPTTSLFTPQHSYPCKKVESNASLATGGTIQLAQNISLELEDVNNVQNEDIYALDCANENKSTLLIWDINKNSLDGYKDWDEFTLRSKTMGVNRAERSRPDESPTSCSNSSSSTIYTWVED